MVSVALYMNQPFIIVLATSRWRRGFVWILILNAQTQITAGRQGEELGFGGRKRRRRKKNKTNKQGRR